MPVIVKFKCPKCKGETEVENKLCRACDFMKDLNKNGGKHYPQAEFKEPWELYIRDHHD